MPTLWQVEQATCQAYTKKVKNGTNFSSGETQFSRKENDHISRPPDGRQHGVVDKSLEEMENTVTRENDRQ